MDVGIYEQINTELNRRDDLNKSEVEQTVALNQKEDPHLGNHCCTVERSEHQCFLYK